MSSPTDRPLSRHLQEQIDAVAEGRATTITMALRGEEGFPPQVRTLAGLRSLTVLGSVGELPEWLTELPELDRIDVGWIELIHLPVLPGVRWKVAANTLLRAENLDPRTVDQVTIGVTTSAAALEHLRSLGAEDVLTLTGLRSTANPRMASAGVVSELDARLDEILDHQPSLSSLSLSGFAIRRVPEPLRDRPALRQLDLSATGLQTVPGWLFDLPKIFSLNLSGNALAGLPTATDVRPSLRVLNLGGNPIATVPETVWRLPSLTILNLADCPITEVPADILGLHHLAFLTLGTRDGIKSQRMPNELQVPPPEVATQGLEAIKTYWRQEREVGIDHLAEAKLLIVGEAGAGKTSLARKIIEPTSALQSTEPSTEGIDVRPWRFPGALRVRDENAERVLQRDIRVNIWDFGGQEIYHSTHQFFLTKRSVYVLVTDERKENTDFEYWLEIVDLLSDGSPVLIVQNRKQGRGQGIDLGAVRQRYPNMHGAVEVDLADNSGLDAAVTTIRRELEQLPHIGTPLPATWREVRLALEADPRDHITAEDFFAICRDKGFTRDDDMRQLGGYLHDLGICLFFQDDALLRKTVVLKPTWGTTAVYRVLDDPGIADALGVFTDDDLTRIWHEPTFAPMRHELLRLMERFGLCYRVPGSTTWIAPQLLSPTQPVYGWPDAGNVVLRHEYDVMPKGIVRRLIVALHNRLLPGDHVWRNGGVFAYGRTRAEVVEDYRRRQLHVRLHGDDPRALLAIIDQALAVIHASYPRIRYRTFLPCTCATCSSALEPATFAQDELEDFALTGDLIQCRTSRTMVDPLALLRALSVDADRRVQGIVRTDVGPVLLPEPRPEVFVSYKWGGAGEALVDELQARLAERGVPVVRDKDAMRYRDSIREFMRRLGAGKCVVVVVDDGYLRSDNCMFELSEIAKDRAFASRVFPVVMSDAAIFNPVRRLGYVKHWESEIRDLDAAMREVGPENLQGIREERDLYETIRNTIAGIVGVLADMNALTPEMHRGSDFAQLYRALDAVLRGDAP